MNPRARDLHADSSSPSTLPALRLFAALASLALGACATGSERPVADSMPTAPEQQASGAKLPPPSDPPSSDAGAPDDAVTSTEDAGKDAGADYTYGDWSGWSNCSVTCGEGTMARTRECRRRDGLPVNCTLCGGECTDSQACSASTCCGTREECCPTMPYNVCGPDMSWCSDTLAQYAATCLAAGCIWTGATSCTVGGSPSNATLPGGMGTCQ